MQPEPPLAQLATKGSILERHAQTGIAAVLLALVIWTGNTLLTIKDDVTTLKVQVANLQGQVSAGNDDRFRSTEWRREKEILEERFRRIESDLDRMRQRYDLGNGGSGGSPSRPFVR